MKHVRLVGLMLWSATLPGVARAQDTTASSPILKAPVFLIMPGGLTTCSISCPDGDSNSDFNARFQTVIPTATPWFALVAGAQWGWADSSAHGPLGFFGGIIPLVPLNDVTRGWLSFSIDPLGVTSGPGARGTNFVLEGAAVLNLGAKMMKAMPVFRGLGLYFLVDQQLSRVPRDANGDKDYWNPALVWGGLLQIAP